MLGSMHRSTRAAHQRPARRRLNGAAVVAARRSVALWWTAWSRAAVAARAFARVTAVLVVGSLLGCAGLSQVNYARLVTAGRDGWQHPEAVVAALGVQAGDVVVDIGAGDGYFLPFFSRAVGAEGRVIAVEVEREKVDALNKRVRAAGLANVQILLSPHDNPGLPAGEVDLLFTCNTWHHIEQQREYFARAMASLRPAARVAHVDVRDDMTGVLGLLQNKGHWSNAKTMQTEMEAAGYRFVASYDFLPTQNFQVFTPRTGARESPAFSE